MDASDADRAADRRSVLVGSLLGIGFIVATTVTRFDARPLWLDESYSLGVANQFAKGVSATGGTMVLYYALLWPWVRISQSEAWIRSLSLVLSVLTMPLVAVLGRRLGGRRLALIAPVLLSTSWMFGYMAAEARTYALETLLVTAGWYAIVRAVEAGTSWSNARRWWILLALLAALGVLAHGLFPLFVAAWAVALAFSPRPRRAVVPMLPVLALCAVALIALYLQGIGEVGNWVHATTWNYVKKSYHNFSSPTGWAARIVLALVVAGIVLAAWHWWEARRQDEPARLAAWKRVLPVAWLLVPSASLLAVSEVRHEFQSRYLAAMTPGIALCMGFVLVSFDNAVRSWRGAGSAQVARVRWAPLAIATLLVVATVGSANTESLRRYRNSDWDTIAALVDEHVQPGDTIVFLSDASRPTFEAAWSRSTHKVTPGVANMPRPLGKVLRVDAYDYPSYTNRRRLLKSPRVWIIKVGTIEIGAPIYMDRPPITSNFEKVDSWTFAHGPVVVTLYERTSPVDPLPDAK